MKAKRFFADIYGDNAARRIGRRALWRDLSLYALNSALRPVEIAAIKARGRGALPQVFIVGTPRSGTTLLYQLMTRHLEVCYVSNFVARFWMAPVVGQWLQRAVHGEEPARGVLESSFGGTRGPGSPHEFSWFWRFWAELADSDHLGPAELQRLQWEPLRDELRAFAAWARRPMVSKALNHVNYHVPFITRLLPESRFVHIQREPRFVVQSILESRVARYDDAQAWWSIRPRGWADWAEATPVEQVCFQVRDCLEHLRSGLSELDESRVRTLDYEDLVADPARALAGLADFIGVELRAEGALRSLRLQSANQERGDPQQRREIAARIETW